VLAQFSGSVIALLSITERDRTIVAKFNDAATLKGRAQDARELFEFAVETYAAGGFLLSIRYSGGGAHNITGAGVWPTVEKAQQVAEDTAWKLPHGADVIWENSDRVR
jgi:hypothetical protein